MKNPERDSGIIRRIPYRTGLSHPTARENSIDSHLGYVASGRIDCP